MRPCPSCRKKIQDAAVKCHYCGTVVRESRAADEHQKALDARSQAESAASKRGRGFTITIALPVILLIAFYAWCRG